MSAKYYYLVSSLAHISFSKAPALSKERFLSEAEKWLSIKDLDTLKNLELNDYSIKQNDDIFLKDWKSFNLVLRTEIAKVRSAGEKKIPGLIKQIFSNEDPLSREQAFEEIRWDYLDEKETDFHFDLNFLICYFLKIQILERLQSFDKDKGRTKFKQLCEVKNGEK